MSTRMFLIALMAFAVISAGLIALTGIFGEAWPAYGRPEQRVIREHEYADDYVQVRIVKAEGRYLVALTVLDDGFIVRYADGRVKSVMTHPGTIVDEQRAETLPGVRIVVYRKGLLKKHLVEVQLREPEPVREYPTIQKARDALDGVEV